MPSYNKKSREYSKLSSSQKKAYKSNEKYPSLGRAEADKNWVIGKETAEFGGANLSNMEQANRATIAAGEGVTRRLIDHYNRQTTSPHSSPDPHTPNYKVGGTPMKMMMMNGAKPIKKGK